MSRSRRDRTRWRPTTRWRHALPPGSFDTLGEVELIRFVGEDFDEDSRSPLGIFQLASRPASDSKFSSATQAALISECRWFGVHLPVPRRFSHHRDGWRRSGYGWARTPIAISWFKPDASVHLQHIAVMAEALRAVGISIKEMRTRRPGYVTYEDPYQVVAVPFTDSTHAAPMTRA